MSTKVNRRLLGWIVFSSEGLIYLDDDGKWWLGGSPSMIRIMCFQEKEEAQKLSRKVKRGRGKVYPTWTRTFPVYSK